MSWNPLSWTLSHYRRGLAVASVVLFYSNATIYLYKHPIGPVIEPYLWVLAFWAATGPLWLQQGTVRQLARSPLIWWCGGFLWLSILWFFWSDQLPSNWEELKWRVAALFQLACFLAIVQDEEARRCAQIALVACVLLGVGLHLYELLFPLSLNENYGRSAGLYENPNRASEALVLGMLIGLPALPAAYRSLFLLCAGLGVGLTLSRSGVLVWVVASLLCYFWGVVRFRGGLVLLGGVMILLVGLTGALEQLGLSGEQAGVYTSSIPQRLALFADASRAMDDDRVALAHEAWNRFAERPLLGHGTGFSAESAGRLAGQQAHNLYLTYLQDHGLLGFTILPLLVLAMVYGARGETRGLGVGFSGALLLFGFFSHALLNQRHALLLVAIMAAAASSSGSRRVESRTSASLSSWGPYPPWLRTESSS